MKKLFLALIFLFLFSVPAWAADIEVKWKPNNEPDLAGYKVYYGTAHRVYGTPIDVGNVTTHKITNLNAGTYYITITAYDTSNNESDFSYELVKELKVAIVEGLEIIG
jgi:hypothetical protein